jgi:hypothetical protein
MGPYEECNHCNLFDGLLHLPETKAVTVLCYLYNGTKLRKLAKSIGAERTYQSLSINKSIIAQRIVTFYSTLHRLSRSAKTQEAISAFQRKWRNRRKPTNDVDPFTMETIAGYSSKDLFRYTDSDGRAYAFDKKEFQTYVQRTWTEGAPILNPFTRREIPVDFIRPLLAAARQQQQQQQQQQPTTLAGRMTSLSTAFQDHVGIYILVDSLLELQTNHIINIFLTFYYETTAHDLMRMTVLHEATFSNDPDEFRWVFADEALRLLETYQSHPQYMYYVCCLCYSMSEYSDSIYEALPEWVLEATM